MALCQKFKEDVRKAPWEPEHGVREGREESVEDGSAQAQEGERMSFPETENQPCRDLVASESHGETEEKHRPSPICIIEVLKKPHSSFWESARSNKALLRPLLIQYKWKVFPKPSKSLFLELTFLPIDSDLFLTICP